MYIFSLGSGQLHQGGEDQGADADHVLRPLVQTLQAARQVLYFFKKSPRLHCLKIDPVHIFEIQPDASLRSVIHVFEYVMYICKA